MTPLRLALRSWRLLPVVLGLVVLGLAASVCRRESPPPPPVTLASGLIVQALLDGQGEPAADGRYVALHYDARIAAVDGQPRTDRPYDSTRSGEPFVAKLGRTQLLPGFAEGVTGMREGGRRRITIPPSLAYGAIGKGDVPPNATLEYDVELVDVFEVKPSGLHFRVVADGEGEPPRPNDHVVVNHRLWLLETGRELASSKMAGKPLEFVLGKGQALPGLEEALLQMRRGARWQLALPPELAYGPRGEGFQLLPGQELLVDVELVGTRAPR